MLWTAPPPGARLYSEWWHFGAPEEIRTPDPQIRSLVLYPAELRARCASRGKALRPTRLRTRAIVIGSRAFGQGGPPSAVGAGAAVCGELDGAVRDRKPQRRADG